MAQSFGGAHATAFTDQAPASEPQPAFTLQSVEGFKSELQQHLDELEQREQQIETALEQLAAERDELTSQRDQARATRAALTHLASQPDTTLHAALVARRVMGSPS